MLWFGIMIFDRREISSTWPNPELRYDMGRSALQSPQTGRGMHGVRLKCRRDAGLRARQASMRASRVLSRHGPARRMPTAISCHGCDVLACWRACKRRAPRPGEQQQPSGASPCHQGTPQTICWLETRCARASRRQEYASTSKTRPRRAESPTTGKVVGGRRRRRRRSRKGLRAALPDATDIARTATTAPALRERQRA